MADRLYRSRHDRMLFGVAGGLARYLDIDASLVRIGWVLLVLAGGAGILLYIVAAILIPEEPEGWVPPPRPGQVSPPASSGDPTAAGGAGTTPAWSYRAGMDRRSSGNGAILVGIALVIIGAWFLLRRYVPEIPGDLVWPAVLIVLGVALLIGAMRRG